MPDPVTAIAGSAGVGVVSSVLQGDAQKDAAKRGARTQQRISDQNIGLQKEIFDQQREDAEPWREAGIVALNKLTAMMDENQFDPGTFKFKFDKEDPSYDFRFNEGMKAIENRQRAAGNSMSGAASKELIRYGQDFASQEYGNEYARDVNEYNMETNRLTNLYNRLAGVSGVGQTATNDINANASNMGRNVGNVMSNNAAAQNRSSVMQGQAIADGYQGVSRSINQGVGNYMLWNM